MPWWLSPAPTPAMTRAWSRSAFAKCAASLPQVARTGRQPPSFAVARGPPASARSTLSYTGIRFASPVIQASWCTGTAARRAPGFRQLPRASSSGPRSPRANWCPGSPRRTGRARSCCARAGRMQARVQFPAGDDVQIAQDADHQAAGTLLGRELEFQAAPHRISRDPTKALSSTCYVFIPARISAARPGRSVDGDQGYRGLAWLSCGAPIRTSPDDRPVGTRLQRFRCFAGRALGGNHVG